MTVFVWRIFQPKAKGLLTLSVAILGPGNDFAEKVYCNVENLDYFAIDSTKVWYEFNWDLSTDS